MLRKYTRNILRLALLLVGLVFVCSGCGNGSRRTAFQEPVRVSYPGRTFNYKDYFNDSQSRQIQAAQAIGLATPPKDRQQAAKMRNRLTLVKTNENYV